jgi:hypothetical protein
VEISWKSSPFFKHASTCVAPEISMGKASSFFSVSLKPIQCFIFVRCHINFKILIRA